MINIAVVDDEERIRQGLAKLIELAGPDYKITGTFGSAQELLEKLGTFPLHFVITDIKMPQMDGLELIKQIRASYPSLKLAILSGFNDFVFARQAIRYGVEDYLLKPVDLEELRDLLARVKNAVEQEHLREEAAAEEHIRLLLSGNAKSLGEPLTEEAIQQLEKTAELKDRFALFLVHSKASVSTDSLSRYIPIWKRDYRFMNWEYGERLLIAALKPGESASVIRELASALIQYLPQHAAVRLGASRVYSKAAELRLAFEEARANLQSSWYEPGLKVMEIEEEGSTKRTPAGNDNSHGYKQFYKSLRSAVELVEIDRALEAVNSWSGEVEANRPSWQELQEACSSLGEMIRSERSGQRALEVSSQQAQANLGIMEEGKQGTAEGAFLPPAFIDQPHPAMYPDWTAFKEALLEYTGHQLQLLKEARQENRTVETVKAFIQQHYREELELSRLADTVYLTPSYLSKLFKTETGETITDYIIAVRIERAKELLVKEPALKTYEVGEKVGYSDPAYFNKVFKKVAGFTPKEYRERVR